VFGTEHRRQISGRERTARRGTHIDQQAVQAAGADSRRALKLKAPLRFCFWEKISLRWFGRHRQGRNASGFAVAGEKDVAVV
jgi:hypothetical protein